MAFAVFIGHFTKKSQKYLRGEGVASFSPICYRLDLRDLKQLRPVIGLI